MSFRLVPKSVTLDDLERRNSRNLCVISTIRQLSGGLRKSGWRYVDTFCGRNLGQKIKFPVIYHLRRYWKWSTLARALKRGTPLSLAKIWPELGNGAR